MSSSREPAVEPRPAVRYQRAEDGVVTLTLDDPDRPVNTLNPGYREAMAAALDRLEAELATVTGVIVTSAKRTFLTGGDLDRLGRLTPADAAAFAAELAEVKAQLRRLERLGRPVVAALNGSALGGGLELALACHHRVALSAGPGDPSRYGLPEVTLGLLPGAGGVTRTVRLLGLERALTRVLLTGDRFTAEQAAELGLVDRVVGSGQELTAAAREWIAAHPGAVQPWDTPGYRIPGGGPGDPRLAAVLPAYPARLRERLRGAPLPAPRAVLAAAVEGAQVDLDTALAVESRYLVELATGPVAQNLVHALHRELRAVRAGAARPAGFPRWTPRRAAVVGAGMMGAGIADVCARAGLDVVLVDVSAAAAEAGLDRARRALEAAVRRGRLDADTARAALARIRPVADLAEVAGCDLLVEAVVEDAEVKRGVFGTAVPLLAPGALVASNTSTLPIGSLAPGNREPDFLGLHFFSPVERMELLEVVVGQATEPWAVARALDLARLLGKTPIVVGDGRGFFTSRVIGTFLHEAIGMLAEGVHPASIEQAALQAGYPTGPLALTDEITLTLTQRIRREEQAALRAAGRPVPPPLPAHAVIDRMVAEFDRPGRAAGRGFHDYGPDGTRRGLWPGLVEHWAADPRPRTGAAATAGIPFADLQQRLLFIEALETVHCLDAGVLRSTAEADVGSILGIGFPAWTGGVARYVEQFPGGVAGFVARARQLAERYGPRFEPPSSLRRRAGERP